MRRYFSFMSSRASKLQQCRINVTNMISFRVKLPREVNLNIWTRKIFFTHRLQAESYESTKTRRSLLDFQKRTQLLYERLNKELRSLHVNQIVNSNSLEDVWKIECGRFDLHVVYYFLYVGAFKRRLLMFQWIFCTQRAAWSHLKILKVAVLAVTMKYFDYVDPQTNAGQY